MTKKLLSIAAIALLAACGGGDAEGEGETVSADTTTTSTKLHHPGPLTFSLSPMLAIRKPMKSVPASPMKTVAGLKL